MTLTQSENYGTVLQAHATLKVLSERAPGFEFELVPTDVGTVRRRRLLSVANPRNPSFGVTRALNFRSMRKFIEPALPTLDTRWINIEDRSAATDFLANRYDGYITGSDEVWNLAHIGINSIYYLPNSLPGPKASFATSANRIDLGALGADDRKVLRSSLDGYDFLTVRDTTTRDLVRQLASRSSVEIIDPTLICRSLVPDGDVRAATERRVARPKILVMAKNRAIGTAITRRFGERADLYSCFIRQEDSRLIRLTPAEFATRFPEFDCVVTDFFHGTCMGVRTGAKFVSFDCEPVYGVYESKIKNILGKLGCQDRYVDLTNHSPSRVDSLLDKVEELAFAGWAEDTEDMFDALERERAHAVSAVDMLIETLQDRL
ncbi:polysaccharide pyruvyl transferase family protein [Gordonia aurantiaca]|uniref:polysaccharide pyruvyl transferase family protein n=1 Tax=Gordonia sp. B21 TaxID=3151852 RepID=UPI003265A4DA